MYDERPELRDGQSVSDRLFIAEGEEPVNLPRIKPGAREVRHQRTGAGRPRSDRGDRGRASVRGAQKKARARPDRKSIQMIICLALLAAAFAVKTAFPENLPAFRQIVSEKIEGGLDVRGTFSKIGEALSKKEGAKEVFSILSDSLFGSGRADGAAEEAAGDLPTSGKAAAEQPVTAVGDEWGAEVFAPAPLPASADDTPEQSGDGRMPALTSRSGAHDALRLAQEGILSPALELQRKNRDAMLEDLSFELSDADREDDTPAVPFEIPAPDKVDLENYKLPFSYVTPLLGRITSPFGYRDHPVDGNAKFHYGVDIAGKTGTAIICFAAGKVESTGYNATYGNYIFVAHSGGYRSFYGHLSRSLVKEGQKVKKGETIAKVGSTGTATGPHLHFEVRKDGSVLDPMHYVSPEAG